MIFDQPYWFWSKQTCLVSRVYKKLCPVDSVILYLSFDEIKILLVKKERQTLELNFRTSCVQGQGRDFGENFTRRFQGKTERSRISEKCSRSHLTLIKKIILKTVSLYTEFNRPDRKVLQKTNFQI